MTNAEHKQANQRDTGGCAELLSPEWPLRKETEILARGHGFKNPPTISIVVIFSDLRVFLFFKQR